MAFKHLEDRRVGKVRIGWGVGLKGVVGGFVQSWSHRSRTPVRGHLLGRLARSAGSREVSTTLPARPTCGVYEPTSTYRCQTTITLELRFCAELAEDGARRIEYDQPSVTANSTTDQDRRFPLRGHVEPSAIGGRHFGGAGSEGALVL